MSNWEALILGIIQGLTEFLPVSSSGHLVLFARITGASSSLFFDLVLHLGSLAAVVAVFFGDLAECVRHPLSKRSRALVVATLASVAVVFLVRGAAEEAFDGRSLAFCFLLTAVALYASRLFAPEVRCGEMGFAQALIVGAAQGLAAFPGLSRSGLTATAGNLMGVEAKENASFCFLLAIPIIIGSAIVSVLEGGFSPVPQAALIIGFLAAFGSGFAALKLIKKVFVRNDFRVFSVYLTVLAAFLLINDLWLNLF